MAAKKPAKLAIDAKAQKKLIGKKILLVALGEPNKCPRCDRSQSKGMVSEYNGHFYCSERCVELVQ